MTGKKLLLFIIFSGAVTCTSIAQHSAQAVMEVRVQVVRGTNVSTDLPSQIELQRGKSIKGKIGSISLTSFKRKGVLISTQDELRLTNISGESINMPVEISEEKKNETTNLILFAKGDTQLAKAGIYSGPLITKVEYF